MSAFESDGKPLELQNYLTYRVIILSQMLNRDAARFAAENWSMSLPKYRTLAVLGNYPNISLRELTDLTQMDKGQISRVVSELEKDGLLSRAPDKDDGRRLLLVLSEKGRKLFRGSRDRSLARQREIMSVLEPEELMAFYASIDKLADHIRTRLWVDRD